MAGNEDVIGTNWKSKARKLQFENEALKEKIRELRQGVAICPVCERVLRHSQHEEYECSDCGEFIRERAPGQPTRFVRPLDVRGGDYD